MALIMLGSIFNRWSELITGKCSTFKEVMVSTALLPREGHGNSSQYWPKQMLT
jgi:hypothetical protein